MKWNQACLEWAHWGDIVEVSGWYVGSVLWDEQIYVHLMEHAVAVR